MTFAPAAALLALLPLVVAGGGCAQVVVLKDSSSGSTWFAQSMNGVPGASVKLELLTSRGRVSPTKQTAAVVRALAPGCGGADRLTGFTLNPHHAAGVDWAEVRRRRPNARAVVWDRTNVVKKAASAVLYDLPGCGRHNVARSSQARKCRKQKTAADPAAFLSRVRGEACDGAGLRAVAAALGSANATALTYEAFQRDADAELARLYRSLGLDDAVVKRRKKRTKTVKRSPEDLRPNFSNFEALAAALRAAAPADCDLEAMLRDTAGRPFFCDAHALCAHLRGKPPS